MSADQFIYLDNAASMRPYPEVVSLVSKISLEDYANPGSIHSFGIECSHLIDDARNDLLSLILKKEMMKDYEVIFTSGATEGNNIVIQGAALALKHFSHRLITTTIEHASVSKVFDKLAAQGFEVVKIRVDRDGNLDWKSLEEALNQPVSFVSMMEVSNMNGVILPIDKISKLIHSKQPRAYFHTDATQGMGKINRLLDGVDFLTFSGHKIGAVRGSGAIIKKKKARLEVLEPGGGQENGLRSGTLNMAGDLSLALALKLSLQHLPEKLENTKRNVALLREAFKDSLDVDILTPENALPFVFCFGLKRHKASTIDQYLSSQGIYVSTTSACDDMHDEPNLILRSMGIPTQEADNPIRVSFSGYETQDMVEKFIETFKKAFQTVRPFRS